MMMMLMMHSLAQSLLLIRLQSTSPLHCCSFPSSWETTNPIFGLTVHPLDHHRTAGGSSGGEGALIAGGGSLCGVGTDLGGSIRIPGAVCGVPAFKPTALRVR